MTTRFSCITIVLLALITPHAVSAAPTTPAEPEPIPDLTKESRNDSTKDYLLGPTGLRGWMYVNWFKYTPQDFTKMGSTARARQILVTKVEKDSPADGVLDVGDVILGVGDTPFASDPRVALGTAINEAEKTENNGALKLLRWRPDEPDKADSKERSAGKTETVTLTLKVLGSYSDTAPYDCPKSEALLQQTLDAMYREKLSCRLGLPSLALLATGEPKHIERAKQYIGGQVGGRPGKEDVDKGHAWNLGYKTLFLCEYYFLTQDESVVPRIRHNALTLSMGQGISGTWGHRMAAPKWNNGRFHGRLEGYADLNQPSLTCFMALVMAEKCGIKDPELTMAINRANTFFGYYSGKGAIPYGYGPPRSYLLTNNGTSGTAAITFAVKGDTEGAKFFSRMCAPAHGKQEIGHTGTFFNTMWTGLGANVAGPEVYAGFNRRWRWLQTLSRKWDGGFLYQPAGGGSNSYRGLSATAAMLLHYCLPRRKLLITGKDQDESIWLNGADAEAAVTIREISYADKSDDDLLAVLGHEIPLVRLRAADALAKRDADRIAELRKYLTGTRNQKIGACQTLARLKEKAAPAVDDLMALVRNPDEEQWIRICAANALPGIGEPARKHLPELLKLVVADKPEDARGRLEITIGTTLRRLAPTPYYTSMEKTLLFPAAMKLLNHPHGVGRWQGMALIHDIQLDDFHVFADTIVHVILNEDEDYTNYKSDQARKVGLMILGRLNIKEGMDLGIKSISDGWGLKWRLAGKEGRLEQLKRYGASAKPYIPEIEALKLGKAGEEAIKAIEASTTTRKLITLEEAKAVGQAIPVK